MAANLKELVALDVYDSIRRLLAAATPEQKVKFALCCALSVQGYLTPGSKEQVAAKAATDLVAAWLENPKAVSLKALQKAAYRAAYAAVYAADAAIAAYRAAPAAAAMAAADAAVCAARWRWDQVEFDQALKTYRFELIKIIDSKLDCNALEVLYGNG